MDAIPANLSALHIREIRRRTEAQPLVLLVAMVGQPVHQALVLDEAEQARLPVVAEIVVGEDEAAGAAGEDAYLVAESPRARDAHVPATVHSDGDACTGVGVGSVGHTDERRAAQVHGNVVAANDDDRRIERCWRRQPVRPRRYPNGARDDEAGRELDGRHLRRQAGGTYAQQKTHGAHGFGNGWRRVGKIGVRVLTHRSIAAAMERWVRTLTQTYQSSAARKR